MYDRWYSSLFAKKLLVVTDRAEPTKATEPFFTDVCEGWRQGRNGMFLRGDAPHQESSFHAMISSFPDFILLFAIRWRTMIISELCRIIGWYWVAQAKKCILCTMYVRKKHNRSGSTSVVVVSKASGKYREIKSGSSEIWSGA